MIQSSFTVQQILPATPEAVFAALTDAAQIKRWSGQAGTVEAIIGGRVRYFDNWVKGTVLAFEPAKRLVFTWLPSDWPAGTQPSIVMCTLTPNRTGTRLKIQHTGLPDAAQSDSHRSGWKEYVFDPLDSYFRQQKGTA
jgi:uncharacterized protein YndB with AHSA1/START domain